MNYLKKSFSVGALTTERYRSEFERIFGPKLVASTPEEPIKLYLDPAQAEGCKKIDAKIAELTLPICDHCRKSVPEVLTHGGLLLCRTCLGNQ